MSYFRNRQTRKQNKGEQKTLTNVVQDPVKDNREWLKTIEKNDPAKLNINQNKYNLQERTYTNDTNISKLSKKKVTEKWRK